jgi:hypothetical protein
MRTFLLLNLIIILSNFSLFAQKNDKKGERKDYIINLSRDTIWGKISGNLTPATASLKIVFTDDLTKTKKVYKPRQIKAWRHGNLQFTYESKEYRPKGMRKEDLGYAVFMKCYTPYEGTVRHYLYYNTDGEDGYYQTFLERSDVMVEVVYEKFYSQLAEYFIDYPELCEKLKAKKYKKSQLTEIVDEYNKVKDKDDW